MERTLEKTRAIIYRADLRSSNEEVGIEETRSLSLLTDKLIAYTYAILEHRRRDDQTIYERQQSGLVILRRRFL